MILIAGGTGTLGTRVVERLRAQQLQLRVLTRHRERGRRLEGEHVEVVVGDLRDPLAVDRAMTGVRTVISAVQGGFGATDGATPQSVDGQGCVGSPSVPSESTNRTDPGCLPRRDSGNLGVGGLVAGLPGWWLLRPLTSLDGLVPGCRERVDRDPVCLRQLAGAATTAPPASERWC